MYFSSSILRGRPMTPFYSLKKNDRSRTFVLRVTSICSFSAARSRDLFTIRPLILTVRRNPLASFVFNDKL